MSANWILVIYLLFDVNALLRDWDFLILESFRFWDEDDYEYEIFSILSSALAWTNVILAGKCDSRRHSTMSFSENVVVGGTSYQT